MFREKTTEIRQLVNLAKSRGLGERRDPEKQRLILDSTTKRKNLK